MATKEFIRRGFNLFGVDLVRFRTSPAHTLLGLKNLSVGTIIDVGANEGQFARKISTAFPHASIFCFEPLEKPFAGLSSWATTQNGRVKCFNLALGDMAGEVQMYLHEDHSQSSSLLAATEQCHELYPQTRAKSLTTVTLCTLDQALDDVLGKMPRDILLKLDVQGFEDRVLRGATRVLTECSACLLEISLTPLYDGQADFRDLLDLLNESGLKYSGNLSQSYDENGCVVFFDAVFRRR
jgi:FkbM family methyltransferase